MRGLWTLFASLGVVAFAKGGEPRPNIVLVLADDLGVNDLGCYGRREHATPRLNALAEQSIRFTSAYCAQPICSPSRAALMTGLCPARLHLTTYLQGRPDARSQWLLHPRIEGQLPLEATTLAELLRGVGYATGIFGKWHLGEGRFGPQNQGFDVVVSPSANTQPSATEGGKGEDAITAAAEAFMEDARDQPFFCYVPHNSPHIRLAAQAHLVEKNSSAFHPVYAAMVEKLDQTIGRLLDKIDALGLTKQTLFIFTSDNGGLHVHEGGESPPTHNSPYRAGKGYLYEGGLRVPLILRWPGKTPTSQSSDVPILLTDLAPTLLKAAGVDVSQRVGPLDGVDATPLIQGGELPQRALFWHFPHYNNQGGRPAGAMRDGDWKLIQSYEDGALELYDLATDIDETRNLVSEHSQLAEAMRVRLEAWRQRVGAQTMTQNQDWDAPIHQRLYRDQDPSRLRPAPTADEMTPQWREWRKTMNNAVQGRRSRLTPAEGDVRLLARDAVIHATTLRYEPEPHKNVLGYWTHVEDWAEWNFKTPVAGRYEIEIQQGCGSGSGGATVDLLVAGQTVSFTVQETGHFQQMILRVVGEVDLAVGDATLQVRPRTRPGPAVMDLRRVVLRLVD